MKNLLWLLSVMLASFGGSSSAAVLSRFWMSHWPKAKWKMTHFKTLAIAACLALGISGNAANALTLDFKFAFTNSLFNGGGAVTGIIRGLAVNTTSSASSVEILSNTDGFGVGEYVGAPVDNAFTVVGTRLTDFEFLSFGLNNVSPDVTTASFYMGRGTADNDWIGLTDGGGNVMAGRGSLDSLVIERVIPPIRPIPLPATGLLLLTGFGTFVAFCKGKKHLGQV